MTKKWRMVTATTDVADWFCGYVTTLLRAGAEGKIPDTVAFFNFDKPAVLLQRYCDVLRDINYDACVENKIKIARGIAAGGGVFYDEPGTEPGVIIIWNKDKNPELPGTPDLIFMKFLGAYTDIISERYKIPVRFRPLNDVELWDPERKVWRKMQGTGASGFFNVYGLAWVPHSTKMSPLMNKVLVSPAEKFADKVLKDVQTRTWNYQEAGVFPKGVKEVDRIRKEWRDITLQTLKKAFDVEVEEGQWTDTELQYVKEYSKQFQSEQWIYARSAEKKFEEIPPGTHLGKAFIKIPAGPLIRAYVLREDDTIKDMMFTGTMHMSPGDALEKLEKELIGIKIDEKAIKAKVDNWANTTGVQIGMLEPSQMTGIVMEACKLSYKE